MPAQHGQTYDPQEEPAPRGGWFRLEDRPYPERLDRAFKILAAVLGIGILAFGGGAIGYAAVAAGATKEAGPAIFLVLMAAGLAYGFARAVGMVSLAIYSTARDGSEFVIDWRALRHDLPLRRTQVVLLEAALLLAAMGGMVWGMVLFIREGSGFGLAMFVLINAMTFWPIMRRWLQSR